MLRINKVESVDVCIRRGSSTKSIHNMKLTEASARSSHLAGKSLVPSARQRTAPTPRGCVESKCNAKITKKNIV